MGESYYPACEDCRRSTGMNCGKHGPTYIRCARTGGVMRTHGVGDWIRFMYQGHLVIDEIAYLVPRASWDSTIQAVTVAHGQVPLDSVLETRCAAVLAQEEPS